MTIKLEEMDWNEIEETAKAMIRNSLKDLEIWRPALTKAQEMLKTMKGGNQNGNKK